MNIRTMKTIILATSQEEAEKRITKAIDKNKYDIITKYILSWRDTELLYNSTDEKIRCIIEKICGEGIFQGTVENCVEFALQKIIRKLSLTTKPYYTDIRPGIIISESPTKKECVNRVYNELVKDRYYYQQRKGYVDITDEWAISSGKRKCSTNVKAKKTPRFVGRRITEEEYLIDNALSCEGDLAEGFVVAHLNNTACCPECGVSGSIGWCSSATDKTNTFRDAICMNCYGQDKITLFEIKTRWENAIRGKNTTYAGEYVALNALFAMKANVYIVIASRDSGIVRFGRITFAFMKANERFLYSIQEKLEWGGLSTTVKCGYGLIELEHKMNPPLEQILTNDFCKEIGTTALKKLNYLDKYDSIKE